MVLGWSRVGDTQYRGRQPLYVSVVYMPRYIEMVHETTGDVEEGVRGLRRCDPINPLAQRPALVMNSSFV